MNKKRLQKKRYKPENDDFRMKQGDEVVSAACPCWRESFERRRKGRIPCRIRIS
jgi:hypothetical protein